MSTPYPQPPEIHNPEFRHYPEEALDAYVREWTSGVMAVHGILGALARAVEAGDLPGILEKRTLPEITGALTHAQGLLATLGIKLVAEAPAPSGAEERVETVESLTTPEPVVRKEEASPEPVGPSQQPPTPDNQSPVAPPRRKRGRPITSAATREIQSFALKNEIAWPHMRFLIDIFGDEQLQAVLPKLNSSEVNNLVKAAVALYKTRKNQPGVKPHTTAVRRLDRFAAGEDDSSVSKSDNISVSNLLSYRRGVTRALKRNYSDELHELIKDSLPVNPDQSPAAPPSRRITTEPLGVHPEPELSVDIVTPTSEAVAEDDSSEESLRQVLAEFGDKHRLDSEHQESLLAYLLGKRPASQRPFFAITVVSKQLSTKGAELTELEDALIRHIFVNRTHPSTIHSRMSDDFEDANTRYIDVLISALGKLQ